MLSLNGEEISEPNDPSTFDSEERFPDDDATHRVCEGHSPYEGL